MGWAGSGTGSFFTVADEVILVWCIHLCQGANNFGSMVCSRDEYVPETQYVMSSVFCGKIKVFWWRFFKAASRLDTRRRKRKNNQKEGLAISVTGTGSLSLKLTKNTKDMRST